MLLLNIAKEKPVNIGINQRQTRGALGLLTLFLAGLLFFIFSTRAWYWYLAGYLLVFNGVMLVLEAKNDVCPINAFRKMQSITGYFSLGKESVEDANRATRLKKIAYTETTQSVLVAFFIIAALYFSTN